MVLEPTLNQVYFCRLLHLLLSIRSCSHQICAHHLDPDVHTRLLPSLAHLVCSYPIVRTKPVYYPDSVDSPKLRSNSLASHLIRLLSIQFPPVLLAPCPSVQIWSIQISVDQILRWSSASIGAHLLFVNHSNSWVLCPKSHCL